VARSHAPAPQGQRLTRLRLENWRNFQAVETGLQQRVFLVGPNAAGKSNLIDAFRFLHDIVAVGGGFQAAVERRRGVSKLRCLAARRYSDIVVDVSIGSTEAPEHWRYQLRFNQDSQRRPIVREERVSLDGRVVLDRPDRDDKSDPARLSQTHLEQVNVNKAFRDIADYLADIRYLHIVPQLVREPERSVGVKNDPFGGDFLEQIAKTRIQTQGARLRRIANALQVAVPQLQQLELSRDERGAPHLRGRYEHWRAQGAWQEEEQFSDGTLRLLGLLWAVLDGSGPLLLEEPELYLHPGVVSYIPQMLFRVQQRARRQVILSTHSPDLLADEGIGTDEVLLLVPGNEGTQVKPASAIQDIEELLNAGVTLPDVVMPETKPGGVEQLALFG
jgi:predicted ATPase